MLFTQPKPHKAIKKTKDKENQTPLNISQSKNTFDKTALSCFQNLILASPTKTLEN